MDPMRQKRLDENMVEQSGMTVEHEAAILEGAIEMWGERAQIRTTISKMSELIKVLHEYLLLKNGVQGCTTAEQLLLAIDEGHRMRIRILKQMAGARIMLNQMEMVFGDPTEPEIHELMQLEQRIQACR